MEWDWVWSGLTTAGVVGGLDAVGWSRAGHMILEGFYIPKAMWWLLDLSSIRNLECDGCGPKGQVSCDWSQLSQMGPRGVGEVTSDAANVTINGMGLSMGNESWHQVPTLRCIGLLWEALRMSMYALHLSMLPYSLFTNLFILGQHNTWNSTFFILTNVHNSSHWWPKMFELSLITGKTGQFPTLEYSWEIT